MMDVTLACRCCLRCAPDKDLTTPYTHLAKTEIYADMIKESFDIHLVVGGSDSCGICSACVGRLRDASDFKLQVQRSQAELQAWLQGASHVKEEELAVEPEMQDRDGTTEEPAVLCAESPVMTEMLEEDGASDEMLYDFHTAAGDGASDEGDPLLDEDILIKPEMAVKGVTSDEMSLCSEGSAARAREQLAMACSVVLERLRDDATVHSAGKPYGCEYCGKRFGNKYILRKHIQHTHSSIESKKFTCDACSSTFRTELLVLEHENSEHGFTNFMCAECEYTTIDKRNLEAHLKTHTVDNIFNCTLCSYKSQFKGNLRRHQAVHTGNQKRHNRTHQRIPTGEKPFYQCSYCDYKCRKKCRLQYHLRKHTGEKPYTCKYCDYKFSQKSSLQKHLMIHSGAKPFKCSECDYSCRLKQYLLTHQRIHTGEKPYTCSHCDYKCRQRIALRNHETTHTGVKRFQCRQCNHQFSLKSHLKRHQMIHGGAKPFKCSNCEYRCRRNEELLRHQKRKGH
ncbi:gastrula zinc finger protein XlCGF57.1-like [Cydia splendana]|uniref:gastrula zinc finger protein XlCGF57.1-like n=1 Tax=Cydia splendana TaxID=1100963 RepID=UPI0028F48812